MTDAPNILVLFPDQWRADWLGSFGLPLQTPNLDRLAQLGTSFVQARCNSPLCAPSRAGLSTGLRYRACGVADNDVNLDTRLPNCWQALRAVGYRVATCGKNDLHKGDAAWSTSGWTTALGRLGFTEAREHAGKHDAAGKLKRDTPCLYGQLLRAASAERIYLDDLQVRHAARRSSYHAHQAHALPRHLYTDDVCGQQALELLDGMPPGAPWCLWVNFPGPHEPFDPPEELAHRFDDASLPPPVRPDPTDRSDHTRIRRNYAAMMHGIDEWCGRLLAAVEERGETARTIVIFASDHGEMLGDNGRWHKSEPYDGAVRVPLIIAGPGILAGRRSDALVELCDLAPTIAVLGGAHTAPGRHGRSLLPLLVSGSADAGHRRHQIIELRSRGHDWEAVTDGRLKLVRRGDGRREVYDLVVDQYECNDLANDPPTDLLMLERSLDNDPER
jgi:arylsulfatase